jgi:hypothetical protein
MASPLAYEQPSLNKAWQAFIPHFLTILLIWLVTAVFAGIGYGVSFLITSGAGGSSDFLTLALSDLGRAPFGILSSLVGVVAAAVPAMYYSSGEIITPKAAFQSLLRRPLRYFLAGLLFAVISTVGFLACILPGIAVALVMPVYVNLIFTTDRPILDVFAASFNQVYGSSHGFAFIRIQVVVGIVAVIVSILTCGVGAFFAVPVANFYIQNSAYHRGMIS